MNRYIRIQGKGYCLIDLNAAGALLYQRLTHNNGAGNIYTTGNDDVQASDAIAVKQCTKFQHFIPIEAEQLMRV